MEAEETLKRSFYAIIVKVDEPQGPREVSSDQTLDLFTRTVSATSSYALYLVIFFVKSPNNTEIPDRRRIFSEHFKSRANRNILHMQECNILEVACLVRHAKYKTHYRPSLLE